MTYFIVSEKCHWTLEAKYLESDKNKKIKKIKRPNPLGRWLEPQIMV